VKFVLIVVVAALVVAGGVGVNKLIVGDDRPSAEWCIEEAVARTDPFDPEDRPSLNQPSECLPEDFEEQLQAEWDSIDEHPGQDSPLVQQARRDDALKKAKAKLGEERCAEPGENQAACVP
jgi:hypothetical protein